MRVGEPSTVTVLMLVSEVEIQAVRKEQETKTTKLSGMMAPVCNPSAQR